MEDLILFGCSTAYIPYNMENIIGTTSYVDILKQEYNLKGIWLNGINIINIRSEMSKFLIGRGSKTKQKVIIHTGACECFSSKPENFLHYCIANLCLYGMNNWFQSFVLPKMLSAAKSVSHKYENEYYSLLDESEFSYIYRDIAILLEGFDVFLMGMGRPNTNNQEWIKQADRYNGVIGDMGKEYNLNFVDIWNICKEEISDSNHITDKGHKLIYEAIQLFGG